MSCEVRSGLLKSGQGRLSLRQDRSRYKDRSRGSNKCQVKSCYIKVSFCQDRLCQERLGEVMSVQLNVRSGQYKVRSDQGQVMRG